MKAKKQNRLFYNFLGIFLLFLFYPFSSEAVVTTCRDFTVLFEKTYDGGAKDETSDLAVDDNSNFYVAGFSYNGANNDYLTLAYDTNGALLWKKVFDAGDNNISGDRAYAVAVDDADDVVYVTGNSSLGGAAPYSRMATIKYDKAGNQLGTWVYDVVRNGGQGNFGGGIFVISDSVYISGGSFNGVDWDYLVIKYDKSGNLIWSKFFDGGGGVDPGATDKGGDKAVGKIKVDSSGNIYVGGYSYKSPTNDAWLLKLDNAGNLIWDKRWNALNLNDYSRGLDLDNAGNAYIAVTSESAFRAYGSLVKYDKNGNLIWTRIINSDFYEFLWRIQHDQDNYIYASGSIWNKLNSSYDYLVTKWDSSGNNIWLKAWEGGNGGNLQVGSKGIGVDANKNVYVTGYNLGANQNIISIKYAQPCGGSFNMSFADDPLVAGATPIRRTHFENLRCSVNILRENAEIGWDFGFDLISPALSPVRASHIDKFRASLGEVYEACGEAKPAYTDSTLSPGTTLIRAVHMQELRSSCKTAP